MRGVGSVVEQARTRAVGIVCKAAGLVSLRTLQSLRTHCIIHHKCSSRHFLQMQIPYIIWVSGLELELARIAITFLKIYAISKLTLGPRSTLIFKIMIIILDHYSFS